MSELVDMLRQIVRQELGRARPPELALVLDLFSGDGDAGNHQADVRLRQSGLTLRRVPVSVARPGLSLLPRVGDPVVVLFLGGDVAQPVIVGSIYTSQEQPPEADALDAVWKPSDPQDSAVRRVHIETPSGGVVTLSDETLSVELGGTSLTLTQDGDVEIVAAGNIRLAADGDITLEAGGTLSASAGQDLSLEASMALSAKGTSEATLESAAQTGVKGALIKLAGMTQFSAS